MAEALGTGTALEALIDMPGAKVLNYEPSVTISLEDNCRVQARILIETRTNAYQVRRDEFPEEQISVFFTTRQYGSLQADDSFEDALARLREHSDELMESYVVDNVLRPLAHAIATK